MLLRRPGSTRRRWIVFLIQALIMLLLYVGLKTWMQRDMVAGQIPDLTAHLVSGEPFSPRDLEGEVWLLHFWAEWCAICRAEQGAISSVADAWPVITVAMQSGDRLAVEDYLRENGLDWPTIVDQSGAIAKRFGVSAVPASFIVDGSGKIRFREMGYTTSWGLRFRLWLTTLID
jgi:thiol-disulfide isomerase/thioredoxin